MKEFMMGADVSSLQAMEDAGAVYYDLDGNPKDALEILKLHGVNYIRLRIWNDPETSFERGDYCNLANTIGVARRVKKQGLKLLLDFHYCDSWADWKTQEIPKVWKGQNKEQLKKSVYEYTKMVLETLYEAQAYPDMVQIGNEIGQGLLWNFGKLEHPENIVDFLNSGILAVEEAKTGACRAKTMLHLETGGNLEKTESFFQMLQDYGIRHYDAIGLSYYPYWAGDYEKLKQNMRNIAAKFGKWAAVVETAFPYTDESHDETPNVVNGQLTRKEMGLAPSVENQRKVTEEIIRMVWEEENGCGVFYWEPVWYCLPGVGAVKGTGNEWENQALFNSCGRALDGLRAFEVLTNLPQGE